jgi:hypothetical protein
MTATCSLGVFLILVALEQSKALTISILCVFVPLGTMKLWVYPLHHFIIIVWAGLRTAGDFVRSARL